MYENTPNYVYRQPAAAKTKYFKFDHSQTLYQVMLTQTM